MTDSNEFFREATLRICGSLQMERALHETLLFLREHMPADKMFLQFFDPGLKAMHTIAIVTPEGGEAVDLYVPFSDEALMQRVRDHKAGLQQMVLDKIDNWERNGPSLNR